MAYPFSYERLTFFPSMASDGPLWVSFAAFPALPVVAVVVVVEQYGTGREREISC